MYKSARVPFSAAGNWIGACPQERTFPPQPLPRGNGHKVWTSTNSHGRSCAPRCDRGGESPGCRSHVRRWHRDRGRDRHLPVRHHPRLPVGYLFLPGRMKRPEPSLPLRRWRRSTANWKRKSPVCRRMVDVTRWRSRDSRPPWSDILAVFAAKTAGTADGTTVAILDAANVEALRTVFWDMTKLTSSSTERWSTQPLEIHQPGQSGYSL